jgi:hypothetical protein
LRTSLPSAEYDDLFIYAPSFVLAERIEASGGIVEGKALGTAKEADLSLMRDLFKTVGKDAEAFAEQRKKGKGVGLRKLHKVQERTRDELLATIRKWNKGVIDEKELRAETKKTMRRAWRDVFLAGLRAGGVPGEGPGKGKPMVKLGGGDDAWLKSAMNHESRFLVKFVDAIVSGDYKMPLARRADMYVDALKSFYESARIIAFPSNVLITWYGPMDKRKCPSCEYMVENNPYVKHNLPTTPRSGMTICLTNCRDKLLVRRVEPEEAQEALDEAPKARSGYIKDLRKIKRQGHI